MKEAPSTAPARLSPESASQRGSLGGQSWILSRSIVVAGPVLYFGWLVYQQAAADWAVLSAPRPDLESALAFVALVYLLVLLATYWAKPPILDQRRDWRAIIATALAIDALGLSAQQSVTQPDALAPSAALMLAGTLLALWSALALGRSFSLLPQARTLVTSGPYRFVRHPMYAGGLLIALGEVWLRFSPLVVGLNLVFLAAQLVRLRYEEDLLARTFPAYAAYRERTSALIPGIA